MHLLSQEFEYSQKSWNKDRFSFRSREKYYADPQTLSLSELDWNTQEQCRSRTERRNKISISPELSQKPWNGLRIFAWGNCLFNVIHSRSNRSTNTWEKKKGGPLQCDSSLNAARYILWDRNDSRECEGMNTAALTFAFTFLCHSSPGTTAPCKKQNC